MSEKILELKNDWRKIFARHISVLFIFFILTCILTFPVILDFNTESAGIGCHDKCHMMWRIWWADYSFENNLDFWHTNHIFYPDGTQISGNLALFTTGLGILLLKLTDITTTWNILWISGFIFGGYTTYLLANNFNRNFYSSIIAGIVFTFSTYHLVHSEFHIGISMIALIPLYVLLLFKNQTRHSLYYSIIGGILLFLVSITHLYYFIIILFFSFIFFGVFILKKKNITNKEFVKNFSIIILIGITLTLMLSPSVFFSDDEFDIRKISEHQKYSVSLDNLFIPSSFHSTQSTSDYGLMRALYSVFDQEYQYQTVEQVVYLGYPVIFLSFLALKFRTKYVWFWGSIGGFFLLMSLGPELRFFNNLTGIMLPERIFYEMVPGWEAIRAPARFIIITNLALAILSSYAVFGFFKSKKFPKKLLHLTFFAIAIIILVDFSFTPYENELLEIPKIYSEIKADKTEFTILELPLGGLGEKRLMSQPIFQYYQTFHEKPIIGGYESRPSIDVLDKHTNYFLNIFHFSDGIKNTPEEYLSNSALSNMKNFDIKYVIIHKSSWFLCETVECGIFLKENYIPRIQNIMSEILQNKTPYFEDAEVIVYKIP